MTISQNNKWAGLFGVWTLHSMIALSQLFRLTSSGQSLQRLLMAGILLLSLIAFAVLTVSAWRGSKWLSNSLALIQKSNVKDIIFILALFVIVLRVWLAYMCMLFEAAGNFKYSAYVDRLDPFLDLLAFISLEVVVLVLFFVFRDWGRQKNDIRAFIKRMAVVLGVLGFVSLFIYFTGWGVIPGYKGDWSIGIPAVALMEWQILLACVFCLGMILLEANQKIAGMKNLDVWISLVVWLATFLLWMSQPLVPSSSALAPREPNFGIYPFNDAQIYDGYAQSAMAGNGYGDHIIPQRPLYVVALVLMHIIAGQNYDSVIFVQSLLLAFFPVLLYWFGKEFFGRPVGFAMALLAVLRDITSNIAAPFTGNLSYSKLYLSEIPTAMMLVLFMLIGMRWIRTGFPFFLGFVTGGILGIGILIRTQVVVAFPVLILFALLTRPRSFLPMLKSAALGVIALALVIAPWFVRNWQMTGQLIFDDPASQTANLALRYSRVNGDTADITQQPDESSVEYNDRMMEIARGELEQNPLAIGKEIASAFINHGINNILLFPLRYGLESLGELWTPLDAFWEDWHGGLNLLQALLLGFYIFLFGLGVTVAWLRLGWLGLFPLGLNLAYNLWTSIALLSGQRFMLTMDWSAYMYYMIGLFAMLSVFLYTLERGRGMISKWYAQNQFAFVESSGKVGWKAYLLAGVLFFAVGASLWAVEMMFPERYPLISGEIVLDKITSSSSFRDVNLNIACFKQVVNANRLKVLQGRALYPRYYEAGDGETFTDAAGYKAVDENRVVFEMVGEVNRRVVFQSAEYTDFFPNASDVTLGMDGDGNTWFALVEQSGEQRFYLSYFFNDSICP